MGRRVGWQRRDFLRLALLSAPAALLACRERRRQPEPTSVASEPTPRYFVVLCLGGGIDPVLTTDPKIRADVAPEVDVPYGSDEIIEAGAIRLGPHFAPLARWTPRMAILNGVNVGTANHVTGFMQALRMRTRVWPDMPSLLDIIGRHRHGQPLGCVSLGELQRHDHSPGWIDGNLVLHQLGRLSPTTGDLGAMSETLSIQAAAVAATGCGDCATTAANLEQAAALFARLPGVPLPGGPAAPPWPGGQMGLHLERALWLLEHDLTRCAYVKLGSFHWDSHNHNLTRQQQHSGQFVSAFDRFLTELAARRNAAGPLLDQTVIVASSEIGRFPRINHNGGKDHFPELPYLFMGPGIATAGGRGVQLGRTGRTMQATGDPIVLDDVGATVLHLAGVDGAPYGYHGRVLRELLEAGA